MRQTPAPAGCDSGNKQRSSECQFACCRLESGPRNVNILEGGGVRGPAGPHHRRKAVAGRRDIRTATCTHVVSCRYNCQTGVYRARVIIMLAPEVAVTTLSLPVGANKNTTWYLGIRDVTRQTV